MTYNQVSCVTLCANYNTTLTHPLDDVLALGVGAGLGDGLGVLGAHLVVLGAALPVGHLPRDGEAVLQVGRLALGVVLGLVLGLGRLRAPLVVGGGAHLGQHGLRDGLAGASSHSAIAAGIGLGGGHDQGREEDDDGQLKEGFRWVVCSLESFFLPLNF